MTEQEAVEVMKYYSEEDYGVGSMVAVSHQIAIKALEEIQQYRALGTVEEILKEFNIQRDIIATQHETLKEYRNLGTVEELRVARDKQVAKKMIIRSDNGNLRKSCGNCACFVLPASRYCSKCGWKLDWSDEDDNH